MTGISLSSTTVGSNGIFTGSFGAVDSAKTLIAEYHNLLIQTLNQAAEQETNRVRKAAASNESPWNKLSNNIKVDYDYENGQFVYGVKGDEQVQKKAMELEYGTLDTPPSPLLRSSAIQGQYDLSASIDQQVSNEMGKMY